MDAPGSIYFQCPECNQFTLHHVIKAKFSTKKKTTLSGTAQCTECEFVHHVEVKEARDIDVNLVLSTVDKSEKTKISLPANEVLEIDMEIMFEDGLIKIARLEKGERSLRQAEAKDVHTIWAKRFDSVPIKVSVGHGPNTYSRKLFAAPDEEFVVGDMIRFAEYNVVIKKIRDEWGLVTEGHVQARNIIRVYSTQIR